MQARSASCQAVLPVARTGRGGPGRRRLTGCRLGSATAAAELIWMGKVSFARNSPFINSHVVA
jgi:hypothetical protein